MRLHVRVLSALAVVAALAVPVSTTSAYAGGPMTLTDLGGVFAPPGGLAVDSAVSAARSVTIANATDAAHTYRITDAVSNATVATLSIPAGGQQTYTGLASMHTYVVQSVGGTAHALIAS